MNSLKEQYARLLHAYRIDMRQLWVEGSNIGYDKHAELEKKADALSGFQPTAKDYEVLWADYVNVMRSWCARDRSHNYAHRRLKEISAEFSPKAEAK